jgi:hypothetical protein
MTALHLPLAVHAIGGAVTHVMLSLLTRRQRGRQP